MAIIKALFISKTVYQSTKTNNSKPNKLNIYSSSYGAKPFPNMYTQL